MLKQEEREAWQEIKEIWGKSSQGEKINFHFSKLIDELKNNTSQWEKDAVKSDLIKIKSSWEKYKGNVSQWEKDAIKSDLIKVKKSWKKYKGNVSQWEKDAVSKDLSRISKISKLLNNIIKKLRRKN